MRCSLSSSAHYYVDNCYTINGTAIIYINLFLKNDLCISTSIYTTDKTAWNFEELITSVWKYVDVKHGITFTSRCFSLCTRFYDITGVTFQWDESNPECEHLDLWGQICDLNITQHSTAQHNTTQHNITFIDTSTITAHSLDTNKKEHFVNQGWFNPDYRSFTVQLRYNWLPVFSSHPVWSIITQWHWLQKVVIYLLSSPMLEIDHDQFSAPFKSTVDDIYLHKKIK